MTPTPSGDNVLLTMVHAIYTLSIKEFNFEESSYQWETKPIQLKLQRDSHVQHVVPASLVFLNKE